MSEETESQIPSSPPTEVYASDPETRAPKRRPRRTNVRKRRNNNNNQRNRSSSSPRFAGVPAFDEREDDIEPNGEEFDLSDLRQKNVDKLHDFALSEGFEQVSSRLLKIDLLFLIAKGLAERGAILREEGCLEVSKEGYGFLRFAANSYCPELGDVFVHASFIKRFGLLSGDMISGTLRPPRDNDKYFGLREVELINGQKADSDVRRQMFENLTPTFPDTRLKLERNIRAEENTTGRIIDIFAPIGKGQRGLLVSPPKSGKTVMLQHIAHAIEDNYPEVELIVLLVDERPEEVTEMKRSVRGEVVASTFDEPASRHVQVADMIINKAKRRVEANKDVVIMLDSITRLARAYNTVAPQTGRVLSGGVDSQALQRPKRFFGAARNIENGGSLTIIATALVETGSKMDEVIYEEFKGTGNMEIHLDRRISEKRIYPAIQLKKCGTRREELLLTPEVLQCTWLLRRASSEGDDVKSTEWLIEQIRSNKTNADLFKRMLKQK